MPSDCVCNPPLRAALSVASNVTCSASKDITAQVAVAAHAKPRRFRLGRSVSLGTADVHVVAGISAVNGEITKSLQAVVVSCGAVPALDLRTNLYATILCGGGDQKPQAGLTSGIFCGLSLQAVGRQFDAELTRNIAADAFCSAQLLPAASVLHVQQAEPIIGSSVTAPADLKRGVKADLVNVNTIDVVGDRIKEADAELKAVFTTTPQPTLANLFAFISSETSIGVGPPVLTLNYTRRFWWSVPTYTPVFIPVRVQHNIKKICICFRTTITAVLSSPSGKLSVLGTDEKKKLRIIAKERPGSTPQNPTYSWGLAVTEDETACICSGFFVGIYTATNETWRVGQERPVMMLSMTYGYYPTFPEKVSNFKIVMVKNLMYDIPTQAPSEIPRMVLFASGCGQSYFLVNAECA